MRLQILHDFWKTLAWHMTDGETIADQLLHEFLKCA
jgi:hypothetical protein